MAEKEAILLMGWVRREKCLLLGGHLHGTQALSGQD